jgi:A/G-specific adenine glycosylase
VAKSCAGRAAQPANLPIKQPKRTTIRLVEHVAWVVHAGQILLHQEQGHRRQGLWKLPEREESHFTRLIAPLLHESRYSITHHRVQLLVYEANSLKPQEHEHWQPLSAVSNLPMPSPYRKVVNALTKGFF